MIFIIVFLVYLIPHRNHDTTFAHNIVLKVTQYLSIRSSMKLLSSTSLERAELAMKKPVSREKPEGYEEKVAYDHKLNHQNEEILIQWRPRQWTKQG